MSHSGEDFRERGCYFGKASDTFLLFWDILYKAPGIRFQALLWRRIMKIPSICLIPGCYFRLAKCQMSFNGPISRGDHDHWFRGFSSSHFFCIGYLQPMLCTENHQNHFHFQYQSKSSNRNFKIMYSDTMTYSRLLECQNQFYFFEDSCC